MIHRSWRISTTHQFCLQLNEQYSWMPAWSFIMAINNGNKKIQTECHYLMGVVVKDTLLIHDGNVGVLKAIRRIWGVMVRILSTSTWHLDKRTNKVAERVINAQHGIFEPCRWHLNLKLMLWCALHQRRNRANRPDKAFTPSPVTQDVTIFRFYINVVIHQC